LSILWARLIQADESLARTAGQVEAFCHMLRQRQGYRLRGWLEEVEQHGEPELQAFARNLHKEESAVQVVNKVNVRRFFRSMMGNRRQS
jgi:hypothetical protein